MPVTAQTTFVYWDKRYFFFDLMTINIEVNPIVSIFTMLLLEESGWYEVSSDFAMPTNWGFSRGCDFFSTSVADVTCTSKSLEY